jgi:hypothetical protein
VLQEEGRPYPRERVGDARGAVQVGAMRRLSQSLRTALIGQSKR